MILFDHVIEIFDAPPPPPSGGQTQSYGGNAPNYNWTPSSFTNFGNLATGCTLDGRPPTATA